MPTKELTKKMMRRVQRRGGCWLWQGVLSAGYGQLWDGERMRGTHRISYEFHFGPIAPGMIVCHRCDVRHCVNPKHLFLGTAAANSADMVTKGRAARGERNAAAKLTETIVRDIRDAFARGETRKHRDIGARFGVSHALVGMILRREVWRHVT